MLKVKLSPDALIQLGILIVSGVCMLCGFWAYCEAHFAKDSELRTEVTERREIVREMKAEIDALYLKQIPDGERFILKHAGGASE